MNAFARKLQMGFLISVVVFLLSPCLYMGIHTAANTDVKGSKPESQLRKEVVIFITVLLSPPPIFTAVLHSCGANVLYIQMK